MDDWKLKPGDTVKVTVGQKDWKSPFAPGGRLAFASAAAGYDPEEDGPVWKGEWEDTEWVRIHHLLLQSKSKLTEEESRLYYNGPREHPFGFGALYVDIDGRIAIFRNEVVYLNWKKLNESDGPIWQDEWDDKVKDYGPRPFPFSHDAYSVIIDGRTAVFRSEDAYLKWKRLKEIEAIPDEKIDTSDIPEAGEDFFKHARLKRMTRVMARVTTILGTTEVPVPGEGTVENCSTNLARAMQKEALFIQIGPHSFFLRYIVDIYFYEQTVAVADQSKD
jgi:hypothetical protein